MMGIRRGSGGAGTGGVGAGGFVRRVALVNTIYRLLVGGVALARPESALTLLRLEALSEALGPRDVEARRALSALVRALGGFFLANGAASGFVAYAARDLGKHRALAGWLLGACMVHALVDVTLLASAERAFSDVVVELLLSLFLGMALSAVVTGGGAGARERIRLVPGRAEVAPPDGAGHDGGHDAEPPVDGPR